MFTSRKFTLIAPTAQILFTSFVLCHVLNNGREDINNHPSKRNYIQKSNTAINNDQSCAKNRKQPIIENFDTKKEIYSQEHFNYSYTFFYDGDRTHRKETVANLGVMGMTARLQSSVYTDLLIHYYDNLDELKQSGGPQVNQELCLMQLRYLIEKTKKSIGESVYHMKDENIFKLIDSFGRRVSGLLMGASVWLGDYDQCLKLNLLDSSEDQIKTRYCMFNARHHDWDKHNTENKLIAIKVAACLPKSCDSRMYKDKYELVENLTRIAIGSHNLDGFYLSSLYCLPDDQSSLRSWHQQSGFVISLAALVGWVAILIFSTYKYDRFIHNKSEAKIKIGRTDYEKKHGEVSEEDMKMKIYKLLSIKVNMGKLFNTTNKSSLLYDEENSNQKSSSSDQSNAGQQVDESSQGNTIVDLSNLEGIKVICMCYVILGHVLMSTTMVMSNGRDMASTTSVSWFIANLTPAFAVNSFFSITGLLTSYLIFKTKQIRNIVRKPISWIGLIIYRYLRILPLYLVVVLYLKHMAKFTGSGPLWDYGTSSIGQRKTCEDESIFWTILFGANFKSPFAHCIPSAWYLANDFQFFLVTPIFLSALYMNEKFGVRLLISSIVSGTLASMVSIFMTDFNNLLPIAKFMPHGLKTYITFFEHNYAQPQYRIPAYLVGMLAGYIMFKHEDTILSYKSSKREKNLQVTTELADKSPRRGKYPDWPDIFKRFGLLVSLVCVAICCVTPLIATRLPFNKFFARLLVALIMPAYHILFSVAIAIFILLSSTGHGNKLATSILASSYWKPLARVSLCALLVNIEIINHFIQTRKEALNINDRSLFVLNVSSIVVTYIVAVVVCVVFEAPLRGISNLGLSHVMKKMAGKSKKNKSQ